MPNKIIIFGDSFADPEDNLTENKDVTAWYEFLGREYEIINHAKSGTGPHYSFKEYYSFITNRRIDFKDHICIFLLSGEDRIDFHGANPQSITRITWDFNEKKSGWAEDKKSLKEKRYYENFKSEIDFLFLTMHDELKWSNFKNLGFLHMNSLLLGLKTIVFCTFGIKILSRMAYENFTKLNSSIFYLNAIELGIISHEEFLDKEEADGYDYVDHRRNHLSQENHVILYDNIKSIINNKNDLKPYVKKLNYATNFGDLRDTKSGRFIYE